MLGCFQTLIIAGGQLDLTAERSRQLADAFVTRTLTAIDDLDAADFLPGGALSRHPDARRIDIMANRPAIPTSSLDITADWLRQALASVTGVPRPELSAISVEPVDPRARVAQRGRSLPAVVVDRLPTAPSSVIIKLHSADRKTFRLARLLKLYRREHDFYRRIRPQAGIAAPALLYGDLAPLSHRLLMVSGGTWPVANQRPRWTEPARAQAKRAVRAVARMHGRFWNNSKHPVLSGVPDYLEK